MKTWIRSLAFLLCLSVVPSAWGQWSPDPLKNLALADKLNNDQVQPKIKPLSNGGWYVSWFDADPNTPPPIGYDVYLQRLDATGVEQFPHNGMIVADLGNSSTEDYGLDVDTAGNALLAFLDTREGPNQQVTAAEISNTGQPLWGSKGVQLTHGPRGHFSPRIAGTTDGAVVVAWTDNNNVIVQKLDKNGHPFWTTPVVLQEPGFDYLLCDLRASDKGSVIVSWPETAASAPTRSCGRIKFRRLATCCGAKSM